MMPLESAVQAQLAVAHSHKRDVPECLELQAVKATALPNQPATPVLPGAAGRGLLA